MKQNKPQVKITDKTPSNDPKGGGHGGHPGHPVNRGPGHKPNHRGHPVN